MKKRAKSTASSRGLLVRCGDVPQGRELGLRRRRPREPQIRRCEGVPYECGLCNLHSPRRRCATSTLTNRCNLKCPICFANANAAGYVFEPTFEQIIYEFAVLRAQRPIPVAAIPVCGRGTNDLPAVPEIVKASKDMGFAQVQVATNGIPARDRGRVPRQGRRGRAEHDLPAVRRSPRGDYIKARGRPALGHQNSR